MKQASLAVAIIGLLIRVYFLYHGTQLQAAGHLQSPGGVAELRRNMQASAAEAGEAVPGRAGGPKNPPPAPAPAAIAERQEIEASLKTTHVTTILPGQPGIFIVDKQEYSEGEALPLPKGRKAKIVSVQDDGVQLTCDNMAFHLDAPTGPDLAALRKKK